MKSHSTALAPGVALPRMDPRAHHRTGLVNRSRGARRRHTFVVPRPNRLLMALSRFLIRHLGFVGLPLFRHFDVFEKILPPVRALQLREVDLPKRDLDVITGHVNPQTAAFVCPNHPEFFSDVLLDWDIVSRFSKRMAFWAAAPLVNGPLRFFWTRHNMIASTAGGEGKEYAVRTALRGDGVLLHPEGDVRWTSDHIQPLFPGAVTMSLEAARRAREWGDGRSTYIVPIGWKYRFVENSHAGFCREIDQIERRLGLVSSRGPLSERFFALHKSLLLHVAQKYDVALPEVTDANYFLLQKRLLMTLLEREERALGFAPTDDLHQRLLRLNKRALRLRVADKKAAARLTDVVDEMRRLQAFTPAFYGERLTQEHVHETLKRIKITHFRGKLVDVLYFMMPMPFGPRVVHVRAGQPIEIGPELAAFERDKGAHVQRLLRTLRARMQAIVDGINREFADEMDAHAIDNRFALAGSRQLGEA